MEELTLDVLDDNLEGNLKFLKKMNQLCGRDQYSAERHSDSNLKCNYLNTTQITYLRLTRIRVEELHKRPQILFFHKFLSEYEINTLQELTKRRLKP